MASGRITREAYDRLVEAYRERPGVYSYAAKQAGVGHRSAKRAWERGWAAPDWARPIKDVIADDQRAARARLYHAEAGKARKGREYRQERDHARLDAVAERAREAQGVRAALSASLTTLANLGQLSRASTALCKAAAEQIVFEAQSGAIPWRDAINTLNRLSLVGERAVTQLKTSMEAMRLHLGQPEQILGVVDAGGPTPLLDGEAAINALGEEQLKKAIVDMVNGETTPEVERLISWQVEQSAEVH